MAYPEPRNLDDIYGPGAENADDGIEECLSCEVVKPLNDNGLCEECAAGTEEGGFVIHDLN